MFYTAYRREIRFNPTCKVHRKDHKVTFNVSANKSVRPGLNMQPKRIAICYLGSWRDCCIHDEERLHGLLKNARKKLRNAGVTSKADLSKLEEFVRGLP